MRDVIWHMLLLLMIGLVGSLMTGCMSMTTYLEEKPECGGDALTEYFNLSAEEKDPSIRYLIQDDVEAKFQCDLGAST